MKSITIVREYKRRQAIHLYGTNMPVQEIMRLTQIKRSDISDIYRRYQLGGLNRIPDAERSGRPSRLTREPEAALRDTIINRTPADVGFTANANWTAGIAAKYIKKTYGYQYSIKGVTLIFKRMNLSFIRPTYRLTPKQEQFWEDFKTVKKSWKTAKSNTSSSVTNP
ncbi:MAG: transposase [Firmicutes bacterium]|nr:transposase [Bacillota bacterium]